MRKDSTRVQSIPLVESSFESNPAEDPSANEQLITVVADISHREEPLSEHSKVKDYKRSHAVPPLDSHRGAVRKRPTTKHQGRRMPLPRTESEEITVLSSEEVTPIASAHKSRVLSPIRKTLATPSFSDTPGLGKVTRSHKERGTKCFSTERKEETESSERKVTDRWRNTISRVIAETRDAKQVSIQESLDFFSKQWNDDVPKDDENITRQLEIPEATEEAVTLDTNETSVLLKEEFGSEIDPGTVQMGKARYIPWAVRKRQEDDMLFIPSNRSVPLYLKLEEGMTARDLEDEGLYVGQRPHQSLWNKNIVESRLLRQGERQWFGEDGQVKFTSLPVPMQLGPPLGAPNNNDLLVFRKPSLWGEWPSQNDTTTPWCLEVELHSLSFSHHPLFSREHVLCSQLYSAHSAYCSLILTEDLQQSLEHKLEALRSTLRHLLEQLESSNDEGLDAKAKRKRVQQYLNEMRNVRAAKDRWESEGRTLLRNLLIDWSELKRLRESQGFVSTTLKIIVHQEETDREEDVAEWDRLLQEELEEQRLLHHAEYHCLLQDTQKKKSVVKKPTRRSKRRTDETEDGVTLGEFNADLVLAMLKEKALKARRKPGEPKLVVELTPSVLITPPDQCPRSEQQRRSSSSKRKVMAKLFLNDMEVCQSSLRSLDSDFKVHWGQIFNIKLFHVPNSISIKIFEEHSKDKELASIFLPVPDDAVTTGNVSLQEIQFSSEQAVSPHHGAVGSGVLENESTRPHWLVTGGNLCCSCAWAVDSETGRVMAPKVKKEQQGQYVRLGELAKMLRKSGSTFDQAVSELHDLDPNDPDNSRLIGALQKLELIGDRTDDDPSSVYFRLDPWETELGSEDFLASPRFQVLSMRWTVPEFYGQKMVPAYDSQISQELLQNVHKTLFKEREEERIESPDSGLSAKERALRQLTKARELVKRQYLQARKEYTLADVVLEDNVPTIGTIGFNLLDLVRRRRPLRPKRKERKKMTGQAMPSTEVKVLVTVMRGTNVPVRSDRDTLLTEIKGSPRTLVGSPRPADYESQVKPFVEVMFQRETVRTSVAEGPHPTWNEQLALRFKAPDDDYSPSSLEKVNDSLHLSLFDEVVVDLLKDERDRESTVHQKLERRWLGSLTLPFSTLYLNTKIEGTFQVLCPPVLLGYEPEATPWLSSVDRGEDSEQGIYNATYLSLFFTLEPSLQLPELKDNLLLSTDDAFIRYALEWQSSLKTQFPQRPIKAVALDLSGAMTPVVRYLRPLKPPDQLMVNEDLVATMDTLARFVSLIPSSPDSFIPGIGDIWTTCDHFLEMLSGDEEEHALLLCNFYLYLGLNAFLLLGSGIPEGLTAYVLCPLGNNDNSALWVWNATTGRRFPAGDTRSPLHRVGCLANSSNVWANVQKSDHPSSITFDLTKSKAWQPFFSHKFLHPGFSSIQPEFLNYTSVSTSELEELRSNLEASLCESLMRWRRRSRTSWNRHCARALARILPRLENQQGNTADFESLKELHPILSSHKLCGFPLNLPWTTEEAVADAVYATGVHQAEGPGLQFALAVHLHPYPCRVLSLWVYVATLLPRR